MNIKNYSVSYFNTTDVDQFSEKSLCIEAFDVESTVLLTISEKEVSCETITSFSFEEA